MTASSPPARQSNPLAAGLASCVVVVVVGLACVGLAAAGYYFYSQRAPAAQPAVEYILDASPRMAEPAENEAGTRLGVARGVLAEIVRPADPRVTAGLRVFGTGALPQACQDTRLVVPLALAVQGQISSQLLGLDTGPNPEAAVAEAMVSAIRDLAGTRGPHTLVVVTGGEDSCNPEAAQVIAAEARRAGIQLKLFVVGYQVPDDQAEAIKGLVEDAGGGAYINTHTKAELEQVLITIQQHVDDPIANTVVDVIETAQVVSGPGDVFVAPTATPDLAATLGSSDGLPSATGSGAGEGGLATESSKATDEAIATEGVKATDSAKATTDSADATAAASSEAGTPKATGDGSSKPSNTPSATRTPDLKLTASPSASPTLTVTKTPTTTKGPSPTPTLKIVTVTVTLTRTPTPITPTATLRPRTPTFTPVTPTSTPTPPTPPSATPSLTPPAVPTPFLNFGADSTSLTTGQCTNLHWDSGNVQSVFLNGEGVAGVGSRQVCPAVSTPYNLVANYPGGQLTRELTIIVSAPPGPPVINNVSQSVDLFYEIQDCGPAEVTIQANINGATGAQLFFRVIPSSDPPSPWISLALSPQGGNNWVRILHNFEMPAPLTGDVEYYVVANNAAGPAQSATFTDLHYSPCKP